MGWWNEQEKLEAQMQQAVAELNFERAIEIREEMRALQTTQLKSGEKVSSSAASSAACRVDEKQKALSNMPSEKTKMADEQRRVAFFIRFEFSSVFECEVFCRELVNHRPGLRICQRDVRGKGGKKGGFEASVKKG